MRRVLMLLAVVATFLSVGCAYPAGLSKYEPLDLGQDLDAATLARYNSETKAVRAAGQQGDVLWLERSNGWALGLLLHWRKNGVRVMSASGSNPQYMVTEERGYGPISLLYLSTRTVRYDANGKRMREASATNVVMGMIVALFDTSERGGDGAWRERNSVSIARHVLNWSRGQGASGFWLFSLPNPAGWGD